MIAILWRYRIRPETAADFERAYGPEGDWARLFGRAEGYAGTELLAGPDDTYLTIDRWRRAEDFEAFLECHRTDYDALDRICEGWTLGEERLGLWETSNRERE